MNKHLLWLALTPFLFSQCKVTKNNSSANNPEERILPELSVTASRLPQAAFQETEPRIWDLLHTRLHVSFDYEKQAVVGKAHLSLKPYFYAQQQIELDAKQFQLMKVASISQDTVDLPYTYDNRKIRIMLPNMFQQDETLQLWIEYVAHPNEIKDEGSAAISDAKGLYFINPTRKDPSKPRQIWTQGETQSNSGWFPTLDVPNEKMTQELYLTVDSADATLSNGVLVYSKDLPNAKRLDYWSQQKPHAPYLVMLAVGSFKQTTDYWRDSVEVSYFLEPQYHPYARTIFGHTVEMIDFFSAKLGTDYPWDKYGQIVVRDYVSGAMENTSATLHGEFVQHTPREHLDRNSDDIIAHELFHQWFGDLVTCESWSNLSLNESFATYGEYLWNEYKYGQAFADMKFESNLNAYLFQKSAHQKDLIRFYYHNRESMFDVVSYQKGSRVLHMLRHELGDAAFFKGLQLYLQRYAYQTAEAHQLRLAFEEVSGRDLVPFFNQWYFGSGHPALAVRYTYSSDRKSITVKVKQEQSTKVFSFPATIAFYGHTTPILRNVHIHQQEWDSTFQFDVPIGSVQFDPKGILLAAISEQKSADEWLIQLEKSTSYTGKKKALNQLDSIQPVMVERARTIALQLLQDTFYGYREMGILLLQKLPESTQAEAEPQVIRMAQKDASTSVRAECIDYLATTNAQKHRQLFEASLSDSSYLVLGHALEALALTDSLKALAYCDQFLATPSGTFKTSIARVIATYATTNYLPFFQSTIMGSNSRISTLFESLGDYLIRQDADRIKQGLHLLKEWKNDTTLSNPRIGDFAGYYLKSFAAHFEAQQEVIREQLKDKKLPQEKRDLYVKKELELESYLAIIQ